MWAVLLLGAVGSVLGVDNAFSSLNSMQGLVVTEYRLMQFLRTAIEFENERLAKLIRYAHYFEEAHQPAVLDPEGYVTNPLNSYHLMKRLTTDWQDIHDVILEPVPKLSDVRVDLDLPVLEDIQGAADALCRLQDTYKLNTSELVKGKIRGVRYSQPMSANDAWIIGQQMYLLTDYYHANMWFETALELNEAEEGAAPLRPTNRATILDYRAYSVYMLGNVRKAIEITKEYLKLAPECDRNQKNLEGYIQELAKGADYPDDIEKHKPKSSYWDEVVQKKYEKLCRGEVEPNHALVCRYTDNGHPYFRLRRVKMEEVSLEPKITVFHDVIYDAEIEEIKYLSRPIISRSMVTNFNDGEVKQWADRARVSQTAFLDGGFSDVVARVDRRAAMLARLDVASSEQLQVLNYGIGGHYEAHYDFSESEEPDRGFPQYEGNRIATLLYYMSDVEQGGATVFPAIGAAVFPRKGSAVLWYNLHRDGEADYRTRHGACPVLIGDKWACNKWFHEGMQEFLRPCTLEQDSLPFIQMKHDSLAIKKAEKNLLRTEPTKEDNSETSAELLQEDEAHLDDLTDPEVCPEQTGSSVDSPGGEDYEYSLEQFRNEEETYYDECY